jgi:hypothetical protein
VISLAWIEDAARRPVVTTGGALTAGLDVAGPGEDETVLVVADGPSILTLQAWTRSDPRGEVAAALAPHKGQLERLNVDAAGIGYYMGKHLEDLGYPVRLINVGAKANDSQKYTNLKAEFYWGLRMRFEAGDVAGLTDERTMGQLAGILYQHNARGQIEIESKDDARKRGVKSPDRAEAVMLAFARPALGWRVLSLDDVGDDAGKRLGAFDQQLQRVFPEIYENRNDYLTCGQCLYRTLKRRGTGNAPYCELRLQFVKDQDRWCDLFELRL